MTQRVLFTGSRTYENRDMVAVVLWGLATLAYEESAGDHLLPVLVAHGDAPGLDTLVKEEARKFRPMVLRVKPYPAAWQRCDHHHPVVPCPSDLGVHRRTRRGAEYTTGPEASYCPLAGPRRNQDMLDDFKPDLVVAFVDKPLANSRGTNDMVERAAKAGVDIHVITSGGRP